jgi:CRP-like cAMP-binding protein
MATTKKKNEYLERKFDLLKNVPLISGIESSKLEILAFASEVRSFHPGQIVFKQGELGNEAYVIESGEVEVITEGSQGEIAIATVGPNQIIGEIAILVDVPRTATVVAMTELAVLAITKEAFYRMVTAYPSVAVEMMRELAMRIALTTVQVREVYGGDTPHRFSR